VPEPQHRLVLSLIAAATLLPLALAVRAAQRGPDQVRAITSYVDAHNAEALALLERIVNINSGTRNFDGVREVGRVLRAELDKLGFMTSWVDGASWQRAGHLVARRAGSTPGAARVVLIGHLDTVFERDSPFQKFERVGRTEARGPGIIDMKGGDVVLLQALKALAAAGALDDLNVSVVLTGDEEAPGRPLAASRAALVDAARGVAAAIGFEDGPGDPRFANTYFNMSQGAGETRGSWNQGENWDFVSDREKQMAVDGGSGEAEVRLPAKDVDVLKQMAERTMSDPNIDPPTGAELGMGNPTLADGMTVQPGAQPSPGAPKLH